MKKSIILNYHLTKRETRYKQFEYIFRDADKMFISTEVVDKKNETTFVRHKSTCVQPCAESKGGICLAS